jgi:hypothetical protein
MGTRFTPFNLDPLPPPNIPPTHWTQRIPLQDALSNGLYAVLVVDSSYTPSGWQSGLSAGTRPARCLTRRSVFNLPSPITTCLVTSNQ